MRNCNRIAQLLLVSESELRDSWWNDVHLSHCFIQLFDCLKRVRVPSLSWIVSLGWETHWVQVLMVLSVLRVFIITLRRTVFRACMWEYQYTNLKDWLYSVVPTDAFFFNHLNQYSFGISGQLLPYCFLTCFLKCLFRHFPSMLSLQDVHYNLKMRTFIFLLTFPLWIIPWILLGQIEDQWVWWSG